MIWHRAGILCRNGFVEEYGMQITIWKSGMTGGHVREMSRLS